VAIVRLEQLYPLPAESLQEALKGFPDQTPALWVQEEPENMGAWPFLRRCFGERLDRRLPLAGIYRAASASPATGSTAAHKIEQEKLIASAFDESSTAK
jgi:2-oxoglutarate dehydrogenase E1 component